MQMDKEKLKIIFYTRERNGISLYDLCVKVHGVTRVYQPSRLHRFGAMISDLYENGIIYAFTKDAFGREISLDDQGNRLDEAVYGLLALCHSEKTRWQKTDPRKVFVKVTDRFNQLRSTIGFSVTNEVQQMAIEEQRSAILGRINGARAEKVFVIMPFSEELQVVYDEGIAAACGELGYSCTRVDKQRDPSLIINDIWSYINNADMIVCDCTGRNANVFYELGLAHAVGKKVICITRDSEDIPFDIKGIRYIKYEKNEDGLKELKRQLIEALRACAKTNG